MKSNKEPSRITYHLLAIAITRKYYEREPGISTSKIIFPISDLSAKLAIELNAIKVIATLISLIFKIINKIDDCFINRYIIFAVSGAIVSSAARQPMDWDRTVANASRAHTAARAVRLHTGLPPISASLR